MSRREVECRVAALVRELGTAAPNRAVGEGIDAYLLRLEAAKK